MAQGLREHGVHVEETPDGAVIHGGSLWGGRVHSRADHRVAMAFAVAAQVSKGPVRVEDVGNVATSFPGFARLAQEVGFRLG